MKAEGDKTSIEIPTRRARSPTSVDGPQSSRENPQLTTQLARAPSQHPLKMQAIRHRGACIARQARRSAPRPARRHASSHDHHHAEPVNESFGPGFWATIAAMPACYVVYQASQPGKDGEAPWLTRKIHEYRHWQETWEERNALHTKAVEQAGFDRTLFLHAPANRDIDLRYPEAVQSSAARNIPAGSQANLDHLVAHYRNLHLAEEERKAKKLAAQME
ncbi:hypothetical protein SODALDRAFT_357632 [Sodiomyces alkalinus F11]|uniref:NADH-ubiquinone oxidoreductase 17.8 kDa subunit n=1 Tax=Sodiomyces alkalinus (strain CBS 110278 / VKM F-3762 / F11) TaxID=1314773 RepID=A0A3N2Q4D4_SODAK|nr:hypothetical protein SODALDRAFT_357632 [Sodiomyces alkalinus F11]ROT41576.1 hypothetical protein SODALDRAFT_357632 [Sodiomyces alkalinus F11]